jgi:hypothetical protein
VTAHPGEVAIQDVEEAMLHATDHLEMPATAAISWQWIRQAGATSEGLRRADRRPATFYGRKLRAARYWITVELPKLWLFAFRIESGDAAFPAMPVESF